MNLYEFFKVGIKLNHIRNAEMYKYIVCKTFLYKRISVLSGLFVQLAFFANKDKCDLFPSQFIVNIKTKSFTLCNLYHG